MNKLTSWIDKGFASYHVYRALFQQSQKMYKKFGRGFWYFGLEGDDHPFLESLLKLSPTEMILKTSFYIPFDEKYHSKDAPEDILYFPKVAFKNHKNYNPRRENLLFLAVFGFEPVQQNTVAEIIFNRFGPIPKNKQ